MNGENKQFFMCRVHILLLYTFASSPLKAVYCLMHQPVHIAFSLSVKIQKP